jgi:hypothetical protein
VPVQSHVLSALHFPPLQLPSVEQDWETSTIGTSAFFSASETAASAAALAFTKSLHIDKSAGLAAF